MSLLERVNQVIVKNRLLRQGDRLIVAVSGGPDSVCLLRVLHQLAADWDWRLCVAHLDHGFRSAAAQADASFVCNLAQRLGWPVVSETVDIPALLQATGGSAQEVSRRERYRFLRQVAIEQRAQAIVLAHHRGDQAETVLLHLLRGAGSNGLQGMLSRDEQGACPLVRPLLDESRRAILQHLQSIGQGFRVDASNAENHYLRNRLRLEVLPLLSGINPDLESTLVRTACLLQAEDRLLTELANQAYRQLRQPQPFALTLARAGMKELPLALRRRVLRLVWRDLRGGSEQGLEFQHVEAAIALLDQPVGAACNWPHGFICRRDHHALAIIPPREDKFTFDLPLLVPGRTVLPGGLGEICASLLPRSAVSVLAGDPDRVYCDRQSLHPAQLRARTWRAGDELQPLGMRGRKKLQDFFVDAKVDRHRRQRIPLVVSGDELVWVVGCRLAEPFRVTPCSQQLVCLEYIRPDD